MTPKTSIPLSPNTYNALINLALLEDLGAIDINADLSATSTVEAAIEDQARIIARQQGVVAGIEIARAVFARLDGNISFHPQIEDGALVGADDELIQVRGQARALLAGERTALNFLQQLSGVATMTHRFVTAIADTPTRITDTRKTTPGWRQLQKWAVRLGGGVNHRMGLYDAVLIKENHAAAAGGIGPAIASARLKIQTPATPIYVEAGTLAEVGEALAEAPDRIMLDNMDNSAMSQAVALIRATDSTIKIEATGGYTLDTVREAALSGVDLISIGALTHSAAAMDMSMLFAEA